MHAPIFFLSAMLKKFSLFEKIEDVKQS